MIFMEISSRIILSSSGEWGGSLARVYSFVQEERRAYGDNLLLLDNGDILQGQPSAYYYNFMDTVSTHIASAMMNYMGYNAEIWVTMM